MSPRVTEQQKEMMNNLTKALPIFRKEFGISQTELARKVGISRQMLSLIELGKQPMTWTQFLAIVYFFRCNNDRAKGAQEVAKRVPNLVEQYLLLEKDMRTYKEE